MAKKDNAGQISRSITVVQHGRISNGRLSFDTHNIPFFGGYMNWTICDGSVGTLAMLCLGMTLAKKIC